MPQHLTDIYDTSAKWTFANVQFQVASSVILFFDWDPKLFQRYLNKAHVHMLNIIIIMSQ